MCGIAGVMALGRAGEADPAGLAQRMVDTLAHRGPDGTDSWGDPAAGVGFGHRRLAIIDLSPTGAQPMHSAGGRYVITYNGEVYNFPALRKELEQLGHHFRGTSDTEVMLAACVQWGPEAAIRKFVGMFAFALFDRQERTLRLVRDRLGVKPMYWTDAGGTLLFGSELRALMVHPAFRKSVDPDAIEAVVRYSYIPTPATIFKGVFKLPAGSILTVRAGEPIKIEFYWQLADAAARHSDAMGETETVERVHSLLRDAVTSRMVSDVPLGAFLSGGTDSSAVVALMQAASDRPIKTFTVGFQDTAYDESKLAGDVARHLKTDHTQIVLERNAALDLVDHIADWFDEPFADSSQLPTYLVSRATRTHVTVVLSGDGGDELFAGYPKYAALERIWRYASGLPQPLRAAFGKILQATPERILRFVSSPLDPGRAERIGEKARRLGAALTARSMDEAALAIAEVGLHNSGLVRDATGSLRPTTSIPHMPDMISRMQFHDTLTYLPDDILAKVDRCTMATSLEAREPLLDHRLVEFVWSLSPKLRRGDGSPKFLLRSMLSHYLPAGMIERPKRGFSVPLGAWLKGPLHDWAENLLTQQKLAADDLFDADRLRKIWIRHCSGIEDNATGLWNILMVQAWFQRWM